MIDFHFNSEFVIRDKAQYSDWVTRIIESEGFVEGQLDYIFCSDAYLLDINQKYLSHDTYTDIITFDYSEGSTISGDIFISTDRVEENARTFETGKEKELLRVMSHGVLHLMGFGDKDKEEVKLMRAKEDQKIKMFHVEQ
ncbi:MAG: rRNA maturation RNase YbeY [Flavobacteriaceae bacterium]